MKEDQEGIKSQTWGGSLDLHQIFKKSQASKLGDAQGIPSSSTNYQVTSSETIFLLLHILCAVLGAYVCFILCFVFVLFSDHNLVES